MPTITGAAGADTLTGTAEADLIDGLGGPDVLVGGGGADTLRGGDGDDRIVFQLSVNPPTLVDGGSGVDILDFSAYDANRFFFTQPLTIRGGTSPGSLSVSAFFYERGGGGTNPIVTEAIGIERLVLGEGTDVDLSATDIARRIESHVSIGQGIKAGSGDDAISLTLRQDVTAAVGYRVDGGPGSDLLILSGAPTDRLIQQTADGWTVYHGIRGQSTFTNVERVEAGAGNYLTWQQAAERDFDSAAYLANYSDLRAAFGSDPVKAFQHYQQYGKAEGRVTTPVDGLAYIASYPDLIRALGPDAAAGVAHYTRFGVAEGRSITFDGSAYAAANTDLARIVGTDATAAARHYITYGLNEGRAVGGFDTVAYLLSNPDLAIPWSATGGSPQRAIDAANQHWLTYGADEGRVGDALFGRDQINPTFTRTAAAGEAVLSGKFEFAGDRDWFAGSIPVRGTITLTGSENVASIAVHDIGGQLLFFDDDGRDFSFTVGPISSGFFTRALYIVVTSKGGGDYTITNLTGSGAGSLPEDDADLAMAAGALAAQEQAGRPDNQTGMIDPGMFEAEVHHRDPLLLDL